jgi:hypothetical protein
MTLAWLDLSQRVRYLVPKIHDTERDSGCRREMPVESRMPRHSNTDSAVRGVASVTINSCVDKGRTCRWWRRDAAAPASKRDAPELAFHLMELG